MEVWLILLASYRAVISIGVYFTLVTKFKVDVS